MTDHRRARDIHRQVNEHHLALPADQRAYHNDPLVHAHLHMLRNLLTAADDAMDNEGIDQRGRDRVIRTLICGQPDDDASSQAARADELVRLSQTPYTPTLGAIDPNAPHMTIETITQGDTHDDR